MTRGPRARTPPRELPASNYFTKQLWIDAQEGGEAGADAGRRWDEALRAYAVELQSLRARLPADVFSFFQGADVHDGALMELRIRDFDPLAPKPAPLAETTDAKEGPWEGPLPGHGRTGRHELE